MDNKNFEIRYSFPHTFTSKDELFQYAKQLEGKTFKQVLDLQISSNSNNFDFNNRRRKGGLGNLLEQCYFGYSINSDSNADFKDLGVELKLTCFDVKKNNDYSAGERLVLSMIPQDAPIDTDFTSSHLWHKAHDILLIYYQRDKSIDAYDQRIKYVDFFKPSPEDLAIIEADYNTIVEYITSGRAHELSESLTHYLGACTKGANAAASTQPQYYGDHTPARRRAFCFKRQYMDFVLHHDIMDKPSSDQIIKDLNQLRETDFESYCTSLVQRYIGKSEQELAEEFSIPYKPAAKNLRTRILRAILGTNDDAVEFKKANIHPRSIRIKANGKIVESFPLPTFKACNLVNETWDESTLHHYLEETRFFFVVFQEDLEGTYRLKGSKFWSMPASDVNGDVKICWERTRKIYSDGVDFVLRTDKKGRISVQNNLPSIKDDLIVHVRPHASQAAYKIDGYTTGNLERDGDLLPDGRIMTKQSFWLNNSYIKKNLEDKTENEQ